MVVKDDSQQAAELRQAFLKHFPKRMDLLQRKGLRLVRGPWDVNSAKLVLQEVQRLAGAAGRHGQLDASERLYQLELRLQVLLQNLSVPDDDQRKLLETLIEQLPSDDFSAEEPGLLTAASLIVTAAAAANARPCSLQPPEDYWRRFSVREVTPMTSENSPTSPATRLVSSAEPPPAEVLQSEDGSTILVMGDFQPAELEQPAAESAEGETRADAPVEAAAATAEPLAESAAESRRAAGSAPKKIFYLADISPFARELCAELARAGCHVERQESAEELKEVLGSLAPDLVLIDAAFFDEIEHLGEFIRRVRARVQSPVPLLLFAASDNLEARLKALRAGATTVLPGDLSAADAAIRVRELVQPAGEQPYRVMIIEDDRSQALFAESVLRKAGMETCAVTEALHSLEQLDQFKPDLILMDMYMPGISGMELTSIIRERPEFISTPIVFLSGEQDSEKQFEALEAGGDDFLSKPIRPKHLMAAVNNRARRARAQDRRRQQFSREDDTGLYERALLVDKLGEAMLDERHADGHGGLLYLELAELAELRERLGLLAFERVVVQVGALLASKIGNGEMAARYGEGSFLLLAPQRSAAELEVLARALQESVAAERSDARADAPVLRLRIGGALLGQNFVDPGALLTAAERCCSQAAETSSGFVLYQEQTSGSGDRSEALRQALEDDRLELLFQPIVSLHGGHGAQYESMLRLRLDDGELLTTNALQELAAKAGLLGALDRWGLQRSLMTIDDYRRRGDRVRLFLDQSAGALADRTLAGWLQQMLKTRRIDGDRLVLEFRLADVIGDLQNAMAGLQALRQTGVGLSLDEFEPDLTALQMLGYLPVDYLKLHRRYSAAQLDESTAAELRQLIEAAQAAGKKVMAARVENAPAAASLWTLGVDFIQGNFVQQPGTELGFDFSASAL